MPARLRTIAAAAAKFGWELDHKGGTHNWRLIKDGTTYPIPAHNGLKSEIGDVYIRGFCRTANLNREDFLRVMREEC